MAGCGPTHYSEVAEWKCASGGHIPEGAVQGGFDSGEAIYVARAKEHGDVVPGKLIPSRGCAYVPWGGEEYRHNNYEVLCNPKGAALEWESSSEGNVPSGALQGGHTAVGEPLFIGRHEHDGDGKDTPFTPLLVHLLQRPRI